MLDRDWPSSLPAGVIHADLFPDNVLFLHDQPPGIIDFYFACNDLLSYDLAICLNAWCFDAEGGFDTEKGRAMIAAYDDVRPLRDAAYPLLVGSQAIPVVVLAPIFVLAFDYGIGPKLALGILSSMNASELADALRRGDKARFKGVSGVGPKLVSRLVLELKDKLDFAIVEDIAKENAFDEAVKSDPPFEALIHTASPFHFNVTDVQKVSLRCG